MIESFKHEFLANVRDNILIKGIVLLFTIGIIPILIFLYQLDAKPEWTQKKKHHLNSSFALTIEAPLKLLDIEESQKELKRQASVSMKNELQNRALSQIKHSYEWESLSKEEKETITNFLNSIFKNVQLDIEEESLYQDELHLTLYGLYSIGNEDIDIKLQDVYEKLNEKLEN